MDRTDIGTLLIPNIKMSDSGTYMCVGSNSIGSNSAPIKVTVFKGEMNVTFDLVLSLLSFYWITSNLGDILTSERFRLH